MASSSRTDRTYHQDYIARIRYSNVLPPPPNPPKLLNIPGTGLANEQYTSAAYASRLAREQPLNIEADAELGMPINLVGLPGVFNGDESTIYALDNPPPPHPNDRALLKPLTALGKASSTSAGVSFLRRTEYISSDQSRARLDPAAANSPKARPDPRKRRRIDDASEDDPARMARDIEKSFRLANQSSGAGPADARPSTEALDAWNNPKHPTNPSLKLLDSYPVLPNPSATPDAGSYIVVKFNTNPVAASNTYDTRLNSALLRPMQPGPEHTEQYNARKAAHEADPTQPDPGQPQWDYELFVAADDAVAAGALARLAALRTAPPDDSVDADALDRFEFRRLRKYETYQQNADGQRVFSDVVALALQDGDAARGSQKGAFVYPVSQRTYIRPSRQATYGANANAEPPVDVLEVCVRPLKEAEEAAREQHRAKYGVAAVAAAS